MTKYEFDDWACIDDDFACRDDDFACIDDDWACIDDDDAVCDDERDGLTEEEADAYEKEKAWYDLFKEVLQFPYSYGLSWGSSFGIQTAYKISELGGEKCGR